MKKQKMKQKSRKAPEKHHPTPVTIPPKGNHHLDFEFYKWNHILYTTFDSTGECFKVYLRMFQVYLIGTCILLLMGYSGNVLLVHLV